MRILPIQSANNFYKIQKTQKLSQFNGITDTVSIGGTDSVSFGRSAKNAEIMRRMFKYGMVDIHTGQRVIDPEWFKNALQNDLFERSLSTIVKAITPYENCLHKVEAELFSKMKKQAKINPTQHLDEFVQKLAPEAEEKLFEIQDPIFEKLKKLSKDMPDEQRHAFDELMENTEKQREHKPIPYKFSKKEFKYKLERISADVKRRGIPAEINTIEKLISMSEKMPYAPSGRNFLRRKPKFNPVKSFTQANIMRQMDNYFRRSALKDDKLLQELFADTKKQIFNIPTIIPFKRKSFNHELKSITDTLEDTKLAREMMKCASKLPTAQEELSAFIMKSSRFSSSKIGHDLLYGSVGAIDHLEPYSHGGADVIENYGFTSNALNSKRGDKTIQRWLKENSGTYIGVPKCIERLIELNKAGVLEKEGLSPWYIVNFAKRMKKLSSKDKPIKIDIESIMRELNLQR